MRNKIIENAIDSVVNASNTSSDFKLAFRQYVKNKFDDNAKESDLKRILTLIEDDEEDIQVLQSEIMLERGMVPDSSTYCSVFCPEGGDAPWMLDRAG